MDNADFAYIDNLFAAPDPRWVQISKQKNMNLFNAIFQRVDQCVRKLDSFSLEGIEGFNEVKEDLFSALERYPAFIQQITSLKVLNIDQVDALRYVLGYYNIF